MSTPGSDTPSATDAVVFASARGRWVVACAVLGSGMVMLDGTVVNVALPKIGEEFGVGLAPLQWTVTSYMLTLSALILLGGSLGDRLGRRRVFVIGVVWFAASSLLSGLAPNVVVLVAARALQGIGGALLTPGSLSMIQSSLRRSDRARAIGVWSGLGGVAAAVGPFLGGWLADGPGWRWAFLINVPVAVVCVFVAIRHVPETRDPDAHGPFDFGGSVVGAFALACATFALIRAAAGGSAIEIGGVALAAVVFGVAFVTVERRIANPMIPTDIFASRPFTVINVMTFAVYAAFGGYFFIAALQLQVVSGYSAFWAGAALTPATILMLLFSARSGAFAARIGPRAPLTVGALFCAAGLLLMLRIGPHAFYPTDVLPGALVLGVGMVLLVAPLTATVLDAASDEHSGVASGVNNAVARAAGLLSVAAIPLITGTSANAGLGAGFDDTFTRAIPVFAALLLAAAALSWVGLRPTPPRRARIHRPEHPIPSK
ncbi:MFS transporter [Williamsia maris]|uniref:Drug resistance transporter, EmrB/QacA subfamily n=1 Tax=Williamsia maris TaxID=72806 RepID=A0ABT1HGV9_9NOCA|nr:MFS transporter [Williamsia maris]MCP2177473.1 drug resistance transporter, EmrB/QacA subfamily [Williamsia maris]